MRLSQMTWVRQCERKDRCANDQFNPARENLVLGRLLLASAELISAEEDRWIIHSQIDTEQLFLPSATPSSEHLSGATTRMACGVRQAPAVELNSR